MSAGRSCLPLLHRLTRRSEFRAAVKVGRCSYDDCFSVYVSINLLPYARLGITVARRVSLKAVARNRIKRQIRESFRQHQQTLAGLNVVVTTNPPADASNNAQLRMSLNKHWERISQICKKPRPELPAS